MMAAMTMLSPEGRYRYCRHFFYKNSVTGRKASSFRAAFRLILLISHFRHTLQFGYKKFFKIFYVFLFF